MYQSVTVRSLPPRERGLKYVVAIGNVLCLGVAPSAGAWIEIFSIQSHIPVILVAPSAGAWIEIVKQLNELLDKEVAPSAGAWIEI